MALNCTTDANIHILKAPSFIGKLLELSGASLTSHLKSVLVLDLLKEPDLPTRGQMSSFVHAVLYCFVNPTLEGGFNRKYCV